MENIQNLKMKYDKYGPDDRRNMNTHIQWEAQNENNRRHSSYNYKGEHGPGS